MPPIPGLREQQHLTNETIFDLESQPGRLAILGGDAIGVELAQTFGDLGSKVVIVGGQPRLPPRERPEASTLVEAHLRTRGVEVRTGARVDQVECTETGDLTGRMPFTTPRAAWPSLPSPTPGRGSRSARAASILPRSRGSPSHPPRWLGSA